MAAMFAEVIKKILNRNPSDRLMPMELWFVFIGNWNVWSQCDFFYTLNCLIHILGFLDSTMIFWW
jgi:hypothetical protein